MSDAAAVIPRLCDECAPKVTRASVTLCGTCAQMFRVVYLPDDVRTWEEIARDAHGDNGAEVEELIKGLQVRIFNQQRELSKLNLRLEGMTSRLRGAFNGEAPTDDLIDIATRHIRRYLWLRNRKLDADCFDFYTGEDLDKISDDGIREMHGVKA